MATPSTSSSILLYIAAIANAGAVVGHTAMGYEIVFPALNKLALNTKDGKGKKDRDGVVSARIGWMEVNLVFVVMSIFSLKWAHNGLTDIYDQILVAFYVVAQAYFGFCYLRAGIMSPLAVLWGIPLLVVGGLLV